MDNIKHIKQLIRSFAFSKYFKKFAKFPSSQLPWEFGKKVVVLSLSPHPDDDVIGWGGWLHMNYLQGNSVISVCLTDGSEGGGTTYTDKQELALLRKAEAKNASEILGVSEIFFWDEPDGNLKPNKALLKKLHNLIRDYQPNIVVLPSFLDDHPDHQATSELVAQYLASHPEHDLLCLQGEIWTPLPYWNNYISIDSVLRVKKQAIEIFETQIRQADFLEASLGLSRYRSVFAQHKGQFIECFLVMKSMEYVDLWNAISEKN